MPPCPPWRYPLSSPGCRGRGWGRRWRWCSRSWWDLSAHDSQSTIHREKPERKFVEWLKRMIRNKYLDSIQILLREPPRSRLLCCKKMWQCSWIFCILINHDVSVQSQEWKDSFGTGRSLCNKKEQWRYMKNRVHTKSTLNKIIILNLVPGTWYVCIMFAWIVTCKD